MKISFLKYDLLPNNPIYISGKQVEKVQSFKLLGVVITDDLTWNNHVNYIIKKANSRLYALRQLKKSRLESSQSTCSLLFICEILPGICFSSMVRPNSGVK